MIRFFDFFFALVGLIVGFPVILVITLIGFFDTGSPLFIQRRVGQHQKPFNLVKFRTMKTDTKSVASHLASSSSITNFGKFLRKSKLDEIPQLWNVLLGEMSLVGPRPGLFNQPELTNARSEHDVYRVRPGITGLAQISGIDMSTPELLAKTDKELIKSINLKTYFTYIFKTVLGAGQGDTVK